MTPHEQKTKQVLEKLMTHIQKELNNPKPSWLYIGMRAEQLHHLAEAQDTINIWEE